MFVLRQRLAHVEELGLELARHVGLGLEPRVGLDRAHHLGDERGEARAQADDIAHRPVSRTLHRFLHLLVRFLSLAQDSIQLCHDIPHVCS